MSATLSKLELVRDLIATLEPMVKHFGVEQAATAKMPRCYMANIAGLVVQLTPEVTTLPTQLRPVTMLDAWLAGHGGKVLSVQLNPLHVVSLKPGEWVQQVLDLSPGRNLQ